MALEQQFYDQLAQRLNRQDDALERIERSQEALTENLRKQLTSHEADQATTESSLKWIKYVIGGAWTAIGMLTTAILTFFLNSHK